MRCLNAIPTPCSLRRPRLWPGLLLLWIAALLLASIGLGNLPLRDWDEGIVARVALEASLTPWAHKWLPTYWWAPYLNKPPAVHLLVAGCIGIWRHLLQAPPYALPPEWVVRLGPALLSSTLVPLVGAVQWRLHPGDRARALAAAAITLTLMPLARHGRLVMLDGAQLVAMTTLWWALLGAYGPRGRMLLAGLGAGLAFSALLLIKAPAALPLLAGSVLLRWSDRDLSRRQWLLLLASLVIGAVPGLSWHLAHGLVRGQDAFHLWFAQGLARVTTDLEGHSGGPIGPLLEILKGGGPWLVLWPFGITMAWRQRRERWGRWSLGLTLLTATMVLPLQTQLPWYSLLLWPSFSLICAPVLASLVLVQEPGRMRILPRLWLWIGLLLALATALAIWFLPGAQRQLIPIGLVLSVSLMAAGWLLTRPGQRLRLGGAGVLVGGLWLSLVLLMLSPLWLWELNETWAAQAMAVQLRRHHERPVLLVGEGERPSFNWYSGHRVQVAPDHLQELLTHQPQLIVLSHSQPVFAGVACARLNQQGGMAVYRCERAQPQP